MKLGDLLKTFEEKLPLALKEKWDPCGLNLGGRSQQISSVLFAYDICHEVVRAAVHKKCQLIISHHPFRMKGDLNIDLDCYDGQTIALCLKNNIALYSCHTNHDASPFSLNNHYLHQLGLENILPLASSPQKLFKLVVFVPVAHSKKVMQAIFDAQGGTIGNYDECSFRTNGTGTFRGNEKSQPSIGKKHQRTEVPEDRLEVLILEDKLSAVIKAMKTEHPYEEVAYDILALENKRSDAGLGAIGEWKKTQSQAQIIAQLKNIFHISSLRLVSNGPKKIRRVAICTGSGMSLMAAAVHHRADLFITGDVKYHQAIEAKRHDLVVADVGHFYSEIAAVKILKNIFNDLFADKVKTHAYTRLRDAFTLV